MSVDSDSSKLKINMYTILPSDSQTAICSSTISWVGHADHY